MEALWLIQIASLNKYGLAYTMLNGPSSIAIDSPTVHFAYIDFLQLV